MELNVCERLANEHVCAKNKAKAGALAAAAANLRPYSIQNSF